MDGGGEIVFSDTGTEWPGTYCFMDYFAKEWLVPRGQCVIRLGPKQVHTTDKSMGSNTIIEYCEKRHIAPMAAVRWCTQNWKIFPIHKYIESRSIMIGIAAEESHRKPDDIRPLVDRGIDRKGCIDIIQKEGLSVPRKSGCFICMFQRNAQWKELYDRYPELFERAMNLEESVQRHKKGRTAATLDVAGKVTLRQRKLAFDSQLSLPEIDMDELGEYQPCMCTL